MNLNKYISIVEKQESILRFAYFSRKDAWYYAASGGGFPINVSGAGVIGAVLVSGQPHLVDHDFLVDCISKFLKISDVPRVPLNAKI